MPSPNVVHEPARETPVIAEVDVLVAGGGPAGIAAALAAARVGARTMLVERYGYLGGMITGAYVIVILGVGDGHVPVARGITAELRRRLEPFGAVKPRNDSGDYDVDPEVFKWQAQELLEEAGVRLRMHTLACAPLMEGGRVAGVLVESKSGREAIRAKVVVDASADADLAFRAGCPCDDQTHEVTLALLVEGVDDEAVKDFQRRHPEEYDEIMAEAKRRNGGGLPRRNRLIKGIDCADAEQLTRAENEMRRDAFRSLMYLRQNMPGWEGARIPVTFPQFGVRLGRRLRGLYVLTDEDIRGGRLFEDGVARLGLYFPDWGPTYKLPGLRWDVPYRALVPESVDGLVVVGRCVSCDYFAGNTLRLIVPCLATGQAGGTAAGLAALAGVAPRGVDAAQLRAALLAQDVYLG